MLITKRVKFEASHQLEEWPWSKCHNNHGHSWVIDVSWRSIDQTINQPQFAEPNAIIDFTALSALLHRAIFMRWDHQNLNKVTQLPNPTSEMLAMMAFSAIMEEMKSLEPKYSNIVQLWRVRVQETDTCWVEYGPGAER